MGKNARRKKLLRIQNTKERSKIKMSKEEEDKKVIQGAFLKSNLKGEIIFSLKLDQLGNVEMWAPAFPPEQVCSFLFQTIMNLMFQTFERKRIVTP